MQSGGCSLLSLFKLHKNYFKVQFGLFKIELVQNLLS